MTGLKYLQADARQKVSEVEKSRRRLRWINLNRRQKDNVQRNSRARDGV